MEIAITLQNFETEVLRSGQPVLVDFWAEWCMPCRAIAPMLREIAAEYDGRLKVGKLNVDEQPDLAQTYGIRSIPNLKIFKNGKVVDEIVGVQPKNAILKTLKPHLA